ncbi:hypothetical protein BV20DRAFT_608940 [Pilatotrama ljubarskyi]|nr:hypothetical protein BV20DRAFT_608940 [Pilatotrama ljubarskyi]
MPSAASSLVLARLRALIFTTWDLSCPRASSHTPFVPIGSLAAILDSRASAPTSVVRSGWRDTLKASPSKSYVRTPSISPVRPHTSNSRCSRIASVQQARCLSRLGCRLHLRYTASPRNAVGLGPIYRPSDQVQTPISSP